MKARFRKALAIIRRRKEPSPQEPTPEDEDEEWPRWAASRTPTSSSQVPSATDELARATELLEVQKELEAACQACPKDKMVKEAVEELFARATDEHVRLKPPKWLMP